MGKKILLVQGFFLRFPSGSLSYSRELRVTDAYILAVGRERQLWRGTYMFLVA